jgi:hypothetical protein
MDYRGIPPRIVTIWQMAGVLAAQYARSPTPLPVGPNWVSRLIKRHDDLQSKFNCKYDYQRANAAILRLFGADSNAFM